MARTWKLALAGVIAAGAITGCGGSSSDDDAAKKDGGTPTTATAAQAAANEQLEAALEKVRNAPVPKQGSPERAWAKQMCSAMSKAGTPLTQPAINSSDPVRAQRSLVRFLKQVNQQLGKQQDALEGVGAPPIKGTDADWTRTVGGMSTVRAQLTAVQREMAAKKVKSSAELKQAMEQMGEQMTALGTYRGPVATLAVDPRVGPAVQAESGCRKFI